MEMERFLEGQGFVGAQVLGEGCSGTVFVAYSEQEDADVALKIVPADHAEFEVEDALLSEVKDARIIKKFRTIRHEKFAILVLEMMDHDLMDSIEGRGSFPEQDARSIFYNICRAVLCCHSKHVAHLDIKPENVLLADDEQRVVLADFGTSLRFAPDEAQSVDPVGTFFYCSPEIAQKRLCYPDRADIWSLGILLHVILTGTWPFAGSSYEEACDNASDGTVQCLTESLRADALDLIQHMLVPEPQGRYNIVEVLEHKWFFSVARRASEQAHRMEFTIEPSLGNRPAPHKSRSAFQPCSKPGHRRLSELNLSSSLSPRIRNLNEMPPALHLEQLGSLEPQSGLKTPRQSETLTPRLVSNVSTTPRTVPQRVHSSASKPIRRSTEPPRKEEAPAALEPDEKKTNLGSLFKSIRRLAAKIK